MNVDHRAEESPGAALAVHVEHPQNLQNCGLLRTMIRYLIVLSSISALSQLYLSSHLKKSDSPDGRGGEHFGEHVGAAQQDDGGGRDHDKIYSGNPI